MRKREGERLNVGRRLAGGVFTAALAFGFGLLLATSSSAQSDIVQQGDNSGRAHQSGHAGTGSAIGGQVVGVVSSGRASVDASNNVSNSSATSGDANGSNHASSFVGNDVEGLPSCASPPAGGDVAAAQTCPTAGDVLFGGTTLISPIVQEGDNRQTISQNASATTGDAIVGQVIGVVSAGDTSIVAANRASNVDATSGDANAHNSIDDAQASNLVVFVPCACPLPTDILAGTINAVIVHEGDNTQNLRQSASASTGDALSGAQVIGAVTTAGGRASVDATNRADNSDATSGDAHATNSIGLAVSGNAAIGVPACCTATLGEISAGTITAAVVQEGDNRQTLGQSASASTGGALAGAEVIGVVSSGDASVVADNKASNTDATSGDAHASNSIADAQASNLVTFAPPGCCPLPQDVLAAAITSVIVHEGDNRQTLGQTASASTGDAVSGSQVIGVVTTAGGAASVDARNEGTDTSATSGDSDASNSIVLASAGNVATNTVVPNVSFLPADLINVSGVILQEGDNTQTQHQLANAISGDAISGGQVIGVVSSGSVSIVQQNTGSGVDTTSGNADFDNSIGFLQTGNVVNEGPPPTTGDAFSSGQGLGSLADIQGFALRLP